MATPIRSCLACRRRDEKAALVRLVTAEGTVTVDPAATLPGRGAYLCHRRSCLDSALDRDGKRITRALRGGTTDVEAVRVAWEQAARVAKR